MRRRLLLAAPLALPSLAAATMPGGSGRLDLPEAAGATPGPMPVWYHRPQGFAPDGRVVVVMHGLRRDAER
jgi:poly(3-hydroxybutyrate) depolymerase